MFEAIARFFEALTLLAEAKEEHLRAAAAVLDAQSRLASTNEEAARAQIAVWQNHLQQQAQANSAHTTQEEATRSLSQYPKPFLVPPERE